EGESARGDPRYEGAEEALSAGARPSHAGLRVFEADAQRLGILPAQREIGVYTGDRVFHDTILERRADGRSAIHGQRAGSSGIRSIVLSVSEVLRPRPGCLGGTRGSPGESYTGCPGSPLPSSPRLPSSRPSSPPW